MKNIFFALFLPVFLFGQNERIFSGKCAISQIGGGSGYWTINITNFNDPGGLWDASEMSEGDKVYFSDGGFPYSLAIDTVMSSIGSTAIVRVSNTGVTGISSVPTTSNAAVSRGSANFDLTPWFANVSGNENQLHREYNEYLIDSFLNTLQPVLFKEGTNAPGSAGDNNYHKGRLGIGDFSSSSIYAKMHLYDVAQCVLRLSDEGPSDTSIIALIEFYRGLNTSRLGRFGYLFNTDNDFYVRNESTGGKVRVQTNGADNVTVHPTGTAQFHAYGQGAMVGDTTGTVYVAGFDAQGNMTDETPISSLGAAVGSGLFAVGTGSGVTGYPYASLSGYVAKFGTRDVSGNVGGLDIRGFDGTQKILWNFQNGGAITNTVFFHHSLENTQTSYAFPRISMVKSRFTGSGFNNASSITGDICGSYSFGRSVSGLIYQYGFYGVATAGNNMKIILNGGDNGSAADTTATSNTVEWDETTKTQTNYGKIQLGGKTSSFPALNFSGGRAKVEKADGSGDASLTVDRILPKAYTVATLPAGTVGEMCYVTDASTPLYLSIVVGGGSIKCPVFYNGTNWVCH